MSYASDFSEDKVQVEEGVESLWEVVRKKALNGLWYFIPYDIIHTLFFIFLIFYLLDFFPSITNATVGSYLVGFFLVMSFVNFVLIFPLTLGYIGRRMVYSSIKRAKDQQDLEALTKIIRQRLTSSQRRNRNYILEALLDRTINKHQCALYALAEIDDIDAAEYLFYFMRYERRENLREWAEDGLEYYARLHGCLSIEEIFNVLHDKQIDIEDEETTKTQVAINYKQHSFLDEAIKAARSTVSLLVVLFTVIFGPFIVAGIVFLAIGQYFPGVLFSLIGLPVIILNTIVVLLHIRKANQVRSLYESNSTEELLSLARRDNPLAFGALVDLGSELIFHEIIDSLRESWDTLRNYRKTTYFNMLDALMVKLQYDSRDELIESIYPRLSIENQDFVKFILSE